MHTCEAKKRRRQLSEEAGVCAAYLLSEEFATMARNLTGMEDPTFNDMKPVFFLSEATQIGAHAICPRDERPGCSLLERASIKRQPMAALP